MSNKKPRASRSGRALAGIICAFLTPVALAQSKPTVTVINPVSNPVNTLITNPVVPVEVSNADPIPVSLGEAETVQVNCQANTTAGELGAACSVFTVPAGKRLVVDHVSLNLPGTAVDSIFGVQLSIFPAAGGSSLFRHFLFGDRYPTGGYVVSQPIRMYVEADQQIVAGFGRTDTASEMSGTFALSGHLVDAP